MEITIYVFLTLLTMLPMVFLQKQPLVHLETGAAQGVFITTAEGKKISAFRGIPYARAPTGKYRFKEPYPIKKWPGVWNASEYGSSCLQYEIDTKEHVTGSEDCLFINVFTPKLFTMDSSPLMEVLVFIHGKCFMYASALNYDPINLMDNNIVVVTFNYRVGILGFLSTEDDVIPGNNGLKDQTLALHWIQKNIAYFGGNAMKVTIAGSLAGGASVHFHYFSPLSQGLFQAGMSFGGTALSPWAQTYDTRGQANKLAMLLGCSTYSSRDLLECLRYRPGRQIVKQTKHFLLPLSKHSLEMLPINPFGPTIEMMGNAPFINKHPGDSILGGDVQDLPWVTGTTVGSGQEPITVSVSALPHLEDNFYDIAPSLLLFDQTVGVSQHKEITNYIYLQYIGNKSMVEDKADSFQEMLQHRLYTVDTERAARLMAAINSAPVYFYDVSNSTSKNKFFNNIRFGIRRNTGIFIQNELEYTEQPLPKDFFEDGKSPAKILSSILINFAQTRNPTPNNVTFQWLPVVPYNKEMRYLNIFNGTSLEMKSNLEFGNRKFWDSLPIQDASTIAYKVKMFSHNEL